MHIFRIRSRRAAGFCALALALLGAAAAPTDAAAQRNRREIFLTDRPAPRSDCRQSPRPGRLPTLDVLADSAALIAGIESLAMEYRTTQDTSFVLLSIWLTSEGTVERVKEIDYYVPTPMIEPLKALVARTIKPQRGGGYLRMRIHPGTRLVQIGRSEVCEPQGPDRVNVRRSATSARGSWQVYSARIQVNADGRAISVTTSRSSGEDGIDTFVVGMLQRARYAPGLVDGIATQMQYDQDVRMSAQ
jgi:hypothetical protein